MSSSAPSSRKPPIRAVLHQPWHRLREKVCSCRRSGHGRGARCASARPQEGEAVHAVLPLPWTRSCGRAAPGLRHQRGQCRRHRLSDFRNVRFRTHRHELERDKPVGVATARGRRLLLATGSARAIRFRRSGERCAVAGGIPRACAASAGVGTASSRSPCCATAAPRRTSAPPISRPPPRIAAPPARRPRPRRPRTARKPPARSPSAPNASRPWPGWRR